MTWTPTNLQQQTEMLPALRQVCSRCPHVMHMLELVQRGAPLPRAMFVTWQNIRNSVEVMAQHYPALRPYVPPPETQESVTCAVLIYASEKLRDTQRFYQQWMEVQWRKVPIPSNAVPPPLPHPPSHYFERDRS